MEFVNITIETLPRAIPLLTTSNFFLMPGNKVPLQMSDPKQIARLMSSFASERIVGIMQAALFPRKTAPFIPFDIGCAGKVTSFTESEDGKILVTLTGVCRFRIVELFPDAHQARVSYAPFAEDVRPSDPSFSFDLKVLLDALDHFMIRHKVNLDYKILLNLPPLRVLAVLPSLLPLAPNEKQALLEAKTPRHMFDTFITMLKMGSCYNLKGN